ncbi:hypothetical protein LEN26_015551 [Aphanomyces euteiches]|nr:hypothetical protein LEN26_015551 [Aphanomyces euteiches]KAH9125477.1 hypothetical protein AeMF1_003908 [Aphanomyces euteiches]KAH9188106.1 hypothetical protein AeNC1_009914 [Aphanomyces euteiches]
MPSESKHSRRNDDAKEVKDSDSASDAKEGPTIIDRVVGFFFENEDFCKALDHFADNHCDIFDVESEEMQLEYTDLYQQFTKLFEDKIEEFIEAQGSSVKEFYKLVKKAHDKDPHGTIATYSRMLVATTDFDVFVLMMKQAKQAKVEAKRESK